MLDVQVSLLCKPRLAVTTLTVMNFGQFVLYWPFGVVLWVWKLFPLIVAIWAGIVVFTVALLLELA